MLFSSCFKALSQAFGMAVDIIKGHWKLGQCNRPMITIFGGHCLDEHGQIAKDVYEFSKRIVQCKYAVITGGGAGVMKHANQGAYENKIHQKDKVSFCVNVEGLDEGERNPFVDICTQTKTFFSRKLLLIEFSRVFVFFPGGFGTADEFFEIIVLIETNRIKQVPVILYDKEFWQPCIDWFEKEMVYKGYMQKDFAKYFQVVDSVQEAIDYVQKACDCSC